MRHRPTSLSCANRYKSYLFTSFFFLYQFGHDLAPFVHTGLLRRRCSEYTGESERVARDLSKRTGAKIRCPSFLGLSSHSRLFARGQERPKPGRPRVHSSRRGQSKVQRVSREKKNAARRERSISKHPAGLPLYLAPHKIENVTRSNAPVYIVAPRMFAAPRDLVWPSVAFEKGIHRNPSDRSAEIVAVPDFAKASLFPAFAVASDCYSFFRNKSQNQRYKATVRMLPPAEPIKRKAACKSAFLACAFVLERLPAFDCALTDKEAQHSYGHFYQILGPFPRSHQ